ncbi:MAG: ComEC/Rec2 family competence protein [Patescibacteria group bacterium]
MTKSKIFLYLMLAFILGVGSGSFFDISSQVVLVIAIIVVSLVAVFYPVRGRGTLRALAASNGVYRRRLIVLIVLLLVAFTFGVVRFDASESLTRVLTNFNDTNSSVQLSGYINGEPERLIDKQRMVLQVKEIRASDYIISADEKILITINLYPEFEYGDFILMEGKLQSPKNFDDFDYVNYLAKDGIFSLSYYPRISKITQNGFSDDKISILEKIKISMFTQIFRFKNAFKDSISRSIAEPNASFIEGVLLGSRESIPQDLKNAFSRTGTTHILAISGYNITLVGLYISYLFIFFMRRQKAFWFTVLGIILFTILTGASASVVRAAVMGILVLVAYREGRFYDMTNSIVFAGALMVALNPKVLRFDVGFQLSFLATLGLIYFSPIIRDKLEWLPIFWSFKENFIATVSAQLMVLPVVLYNFGSFSLISLPANVLILPVIPLTMLFGFLSGVLGLIWSQLGEIAGLAAWVLAEYEILIVKFFSQIS